MTKKVYTCFPSFKISFFLNYEFGDFLYIASSYVCHIYIMLGSLHSLLHISKLSLALSTSQIYPANASLSLTLIFHHRQVVPSNACWSLSEDRVYQVSIISDSTDSLISELSYTIVVIIIYLLKARRLRFGMICSRLQSNKK